MNCKYDLSGTYLMTKSEFLAKHGTDRPRCELCRKYYRLPGSVFTPRDKICFTCEMQYKNMEAFEAFYLKIGSKEMLQDISPTTYASDLLGENK